MKSRFSTYTATAAVPTLAILTLAMGALTLPASAQVQPPRDFQKHFPILSSTRSVATPAP